MELKALVGLRGIREVEGWWGRALVRICGILVGRHRELVTCRREEEEEEEEEGDGR